jgi:hypothetical protein
VGPERCLSGPSVVGFVSAGVPDSGFSFIMDLPLLVKDREIWWILLL